MNTLPDSFGIPNLALKLSQEPLNYSVHSRRRGTKAVLLSLIQSHRSPLNVHPVGDGVRSASLRPVLCAYAPHALHSSLALCLIVDQFGEGPERAGVYLHGLK
jgi:hypothetical protein